eukprot:scaffold20785_cov63-Phaeocystis_antarctica.AAC.2
MFVPQGERRTRVGAQGSDRVGRELGTAHAATGGAWTHPDRGTGQRTKPPHSPETPQIITSLEKGDDRPGLAPQSVQWRSGSCCAVAAARVVVGNNWPDSAAPCW